MAGCGKSVSKHEPSIPRDGAIEKKIKSQLSKMTLDDKIGQMLQLELSTMGSARFGEASFAVNETIMDSLIGKYRTGSVLNTPGRAVKAEHWYRIISDIQKKSLETIGIPCIYGLDQNHGASYVSGSLALKSRRALLTTISEGAPFGLMLPFTTACGWYCVL